MSSWPHWRRLFRLPAKDRTVGTDVDAEVAFHLDMRARELMSLGMSPEAAREEATRRFGDVAEARAALIRTDQAAIRRTGRTTWLTDLGRDLRFSIRELRRHWAFSLLAVSVLGFGIGMTTSMVSLFDRLALRPLPYPNADRLGVLWLVTAQGEQQMRLTPQRQLIAALDSVPGIERADRYRSEQRTADYPAGPELAGVRLVSGGLLSGLGARSALGRSLSPDDTLPGAPLVVLLAEHTWRRHFGARQDVLGTSIRLDNQVAVIVGVVRAGFDLVSIDAGARTDLWVPLRDDLAEPGRDAASVLLTLAPGSQGPTVADQIGARMAALAPSGDGLVKNFRPLVLGAQELVGSATRRTLHLLLGAVGLVLLIACANVAALLLGQAAGRFQEFGVRAALGAGRGRVTRQLVTEAGVLGVLGAATGVLITAAVLALARATRPDPLIVIDEIRIDVLTLAISVLTAAVAVLLFSLAPIWAVSRADLTASVVGRTRRAADGRNTGRLRSVLVIGQIATTLVLMLAAGLLIKSFVRERTLPLGFDADNLARLELSFPELDFPNVGTRIQLSLDLLDRVRRTPGVLAASMSANSPLDFGVAYGEFLAEGRPMSTEEAKFIMPLRVVDSIYFRVIGLPLIAGRTFSSDSARNELIVDATTARKIWGSYDIIGKRVRLSRDESDWQTIVGVAADVRVLHAEFADVPNLYYPLMPAESGRTLLVRVANSETMRVVNRLVRETHAGIRIRSVATTAAVLDERLANTRFTMLIVGWFSALALGVAMVGLYGIIAYSVRQRHFEFGVRLALGASPGRVTGMVIRDGLSQAGLGVAIGLLGSLGLVQVIRGLLYQMSPFDPTVFALATLLLLAVALLAVWVPAHRASRVDPLEAIRND